MDKEKLSTGANLLRVSTLGINFVLCTFLGVFLGWGAQKLFHLGNWVIFVGLFFGIITAYFTVYESLKELRSSMKGPPKP
jgi:F0F1-type ATP synthase assembly protein I